jgi:hypothetical protein
MSWLPPLRASAALLALAATAGSAAADAVFPPGSRLGLTPPAGLEQSQSFPGFADREKNAAILMVEMPAGAYPEIEKTLTNDALKKQGFVVEKREPFPLKGGKALVLIGRQEAQGTRFRKWLLLASTSDLTALVTVQVPQAAKETYPDDTIRTALASFAVRASVPIDEQLGLLPFKLGELAGFRVVRVIGNSVLLTDGPKDELDAVDQPHLIVAAAAGGPAQPGDRDAFARQAISDIANFKELRLIGFDALRIGGQPGHEIRAEAKEPVSGKDVSLVQWLRFGSSAYLRLVAVATKETWPEFYPRFRAVRDAIEPR